MWNESEPRFIGMAITWPLACATTVFLCLFLIWFVDEPLAKLLVETHAYFPRWLEVPVEPILEFLGIIAVACWFVRVCNHNRSGLAAAGLLAAASALTASLVVDFILKPVFGRRLVFDFVYRNEHAQFDWFHGNYASGFPSGHAAIAASVATILWQYIPRYRYLYIILPALFSFVLVIGDWHYASDVVAGSFVGTSIALLVLYCANVVGS